MRRRAISLTLACAAAASLGYAALVRGPRGGPIDAIPAGSYFVAQLDMDALRASPLYAALEKERTLAPIADLALACGFDPMTRVQELDFAIPEGGEPGDFGLAASATLTQDELVRCATNVAAEHGDTRTVQQVGPFYLTADAKGHALAAKDGGPILVGRAPWVRSMVDAALGRAPSLRASKEHMALRDALTQASQARPLFLATVLLPRDLRERLKKEMVAEANDPRANVAMGAVLGVNAAGVSVRLGPGGLLDARAELRCETDAACADVAKLILTKRLAWSQDLALRIVGVGPLIDALEVDAHGTSVAATTRVQVSDVTAALERLSKFRDKGIKRPAPSPSTRPPDEVLRAPEKSR
jgi:hypothetical protein